MLTRTKIYANNGHTHGVSVRKKSGRYRRRGPNKVTEVHRHDGDDDNDDGDDDDDDDADDDDDDADDDDDDVVGDADTQNVRPARQVRSKEVASQTKEQKYDMMMMMMVVVVMMMMTS